MFLVVCKTFSELRTCFQYFHVIFSFRENSLGTIPSGKVFSFMFYWNCMKFGLVIGRMLLKVTIESVFELASSIIEISGLSYLFTLLKI